MGVLKSNAVKVWLGERAIEAPTMWRPWKYHGKWQAPELSLRKQSLMAKQAIRQGDIKLEPVLMPPPPTFKGHKREKVWPIRRADVAARMAEMPQLIAEYRQARRIKRAKAREANRFK